MTRARSVTLAGLVGVVLLAGASPAFADDVPNLNVVASCRAGAQAYPGGGGESACLADEKQAHETLVRQWSQYAAESRARCTQMVSDVPGTQSYIELLSCLEMAKDVQGLPKDKD